MAELSWRSWSSLVGSKRHWKAVWGLCLPVKECWFVYGQQEWLVIILMPCLNDWCCCSCLKAIFFPGMPCHRHRDTGLCIFETILCLCAQAFFLLSMLLITVYHTSEFCLAWCADLVLHLGQLHYDVQVLRFHAMGATIKHVNQILEKEFKRSRYKFLKFDDI